MPNSPSVPNQEITLRSVLPLTLSILVSFSAVAVCTGGCPTDSAVQGSTLDGDLSGIFPQNGGAGGASGIQLPDIAVATPFEGELKIALANAAAIENSDIRFTVVVPPDRGTLSVATRSSNGVYYVTYAAPDDFLGQTQFTYKASDGVSESNTATVTIHVVPDIRFSVDRLDGDRDLTVVASAFCVPDGPLPEGIYAWHFDDQVISGPTSTHSGKSYTFTSGGAHLVRLAVTLAGLGTTLNCAHGPTGNEQQARVIVRPIVAGLVRDADGTPLSGVEISATSGAESTHTDDQGRYQITVPFEWTGEITPNQSGRLFAPANHAVSSLAADASNMDFEAGDGTTRVNRAPRADVVSVDTDEDVAVPVQLLGSDPDDDPLQYVITSLPTSGTMTDMGDGHLIASADLPYTLVFRGEKVNYTPAANFVGPVSFQFKVFDGQALSTAQAATVRMRAVNDTPSIVQSDPVNRTVLPNSNASNPLNRFNFSATDPDAGASSLMWSISTPATRGTAAVVSGSPSSSGANITVTYVPNPNVSGSDSFVVRVTDAAGASDTISVNISIQNGTPPVITQSSPIAMNVQQNSQPSGAANRITLQATDVDALPNTLVWTITPTPGRGTATVVSGSPSNSGGNVVISYAPNSSVTGSDTFGVRVTDANGNSAAVTVNVTIAALGSIPPVLSQDGPTTLTVQQNSSPTSPSNRFTLFATDTDAAANSLVWSISPQGTRGTAAIVSGSPSSSGGVVTLSYGPNAGVTGSDTFTIRVVDANNNSDTLVVNVTIAPIGSVPPSINQSDPFALSVQQNSSPGSPSNRFTLSANDSDAAPNSLVWTISPQPTRGTAAIVSGSPSSSGGTVTFSYGPNANVTGSDTFTVRVSDSNNNQDTIVVNVTIAPAGNTPPTITQNNPLSLTVAQNSSPTDPGNRFALSATDPDAGPTSLVWTISSQATRGTAAVASGSPSSSGSSVTISYGPNSNVTGSDSFTVRVTDAAGAFASINANVSITTPTPPGTFYVDTNNPNASDTNPGTETQPFKTIQRAANTVNPGDTVYIKGGVYRETVIITRSGTASQRITFRRYQNQEPIIDAQRTRVTCMFIGRNQAPGGGHYVTIDGLTMRNATAGSGSGHLTMHGCTNVQIRNCHMYCDNWTADDYVGGVSFSGPTEDVLIENNHIHNMFAGIGGRWSPTADYPGRPKRITQRNNHVHHIHVNDHLQQNHASGIGGSNNCEDFLLEGNLVHHVDDFCIGINETGAPTTIQYNIAYITAYTPDNGGGGNGIKIKPVTGTGNGGNGAPWRDIVRYNVVFLASTGIHLIVFGDGYGHLCYQNTSIKNSVDGIDYGTYADGNRITYVKNNLFAYNANRDLKINSATPAGAVDYNYVMDGWGVSASLSPHTMTQGTHGLPMLANPGLLDQGRDSEGTPTILQPLNDPAQYPDAASAIVYARNAVRQIAGLQAGSPCIDGGVNLNLNMPDFFGNNATDNPNRSDPWSNDGEPGVYDLGAIEFVAP